MPGQVLLYVCFLISPSMECDSLATGVGLDPLLLVQRLSLAPV